MAGALTISTLNDSSGVLATQNGMNGIAKAWVQFVGSTGAINGSFNVSSITRNAAGNYTVNFTTAMTNTAYSAVVHGGVASTNSSFGAAQIFSSAIGTTVAPTTSSFQFIYVHTANLVLQDSPYLCATVIGA